MVKEFSNEKRIQILYNISWTGTIDKRLSSSLYNWKVRRNYSELSLQNMGHLCLFVMSQFEVVGCYKNIPELIKNIFVFDLYICVCSDISLFITVIPKVGSCWWKGPEGW